jgi:signal transduction histidine kinase
LTTTFQMLDRQVRQMSRLVDDLLDLSRVTRGKIELRKEPVEVGPIIDQAVEATRSQYGPLSQHLTVNLPTSPVRVVADPARLSQVIANLLNNACKFTDPGGQIVGAELGDGAGAGLAGKQPRPGLLHAASQRRDETQARNDDPAHRPKTFCA